MTAALQARLIAYRDQLGNAESKALIADALDELSRRTWRESVLVEALTGVLPYATACIGLPRACWPADSVILRAEGAIAAAHAAAATPTA